MENKIKEESINKLLLDLFNNSYNEYFAISNIKKLLDENGFICLLENELLIEGKIKTVEFG